MSHAFVFGGEQVLPSLTNAKRKIKNMEFLCPPLSHGKLNCPQNVHCHHAMNGGCQAAKPPAKLEVAVQ